MNSVTQYPLSVHFDRQQIQNNSKTQNGRWKRNLFLRAKCIFRKDYIFLGNLFY